MWHISHMMTNCPSSGRCHDHVTHFWILHPWNISGTANARDFKIRILAGRVKYQLCDAWLSRRWTGSWSRRDPFLHFWAQAISLELINLDISNLVCRLNLNSTGIKHVKVRLYWVYLGSRDLLQFWEISALSLVNRRFEAKRANYCKFHIIETTESILTKFGTTIETTKWLSWVVPNPNSRPANPRWRTAAILKTVKSPYLCNRVTETPNSGLRKFRHGISIVETCYRLISRKVDAQSVINWAVVSQLSR